jgi:hypothetical protein
MTPPYDPIQLDLLPNNPTSATRPMGGVGFNHEVMVWFAAVHS